MGKPLKVPSLARSVIKPLKVPSLARSVPKPLKVSSLARSVLKPLKVPSLARSVRAGVGAVAGAKEEEKKAISTQAVCIPPGYPSEARLGWTDGWAGKVGKNHVFSTFLEKYSIFFHSCFFA